MRELSPWARKSQGRDAHRAFYAAYMTSAAWYRRRVRWAEDETVLCAPGPIVCIGGCGRRWALNRDDLHHCDYDRLGREDHEDLWPMCRACHTALHELLDSTQSWRRLPRRQANHLALEVLKDHYDAPQRGTPRVEGLRDFL